MFMHSAFAMLLFAFNLVSLKYRKQFISRNFESKLRCDLLST